MDALLAKWGGTGDAAAGPVTGSYLFLQETFLDLPQTFLVCGDQMQVITGLFEERIRKKLSEDFHDMGGIY